MGVDPQQTAFIKSYILGQLSSAERDSFEEAYFNDDGLFLELKEAEDSLIREYFRGGLDPRERALFEENFLTLPGRRASLLLAGAMEEISRGKTGIAELLQLIRQVTRSILSSFMDFTGRPFRALALVSALVILGLVFMLNRGSEMNDSSKQIAATAPVSPPSTAPDAGSSAPFEFKLARSNQKRGSGISETQILIREPASRIYNLLLDVKGYSYPKFKGILHRLNANDVIIETRQSLKAVTKGNDRFVIFQVESEKLPPGTYEVALEGQDSSGIALDWSYYAFTVRD